MTPINKILQVKLRIFRWKYFPDTNQEFPYWRTLLREAAREPTTAKELVMIYPKFLVWVDAFGEGVGGGLLTGKDALEPTIWYLKRPNKLWVKADHSNKPRGGLG